MRLFCKSHYTTVPYLSMWNTGNYTDLNWHLLIQQIKIKEYILEKVALKLKHRKINKQKFSGKNNV